MAAAAALGLARMGVSIDSAGDIATKSADAFDRLTGSLQSTVSSLDALRSVTGGTAQDAGRASALFGALGLSMSDTARMANQLRDRLSSDTFAMQAFGRSMADARLGGSQNNLSILLEGLEILRAQPAGEQRLLVARRLQLEALLTLANASEDVADSALRAGDRLGHLLNPEYERALADFNVQWSELQTNFKILGTTIAKEFLPALNTVLELMNRWLEQRQGRAGRPDVDLPTTGNPLTDIAARLGREIYRAITGGGDSPQAEQTRAIKENTLEIRNANRRFVGGGQRTRAAIPAGLRGKALDDSLRSQSMKLGTLIP